MKNPFAFTDRYTYWNYFWNLAKNYTRFRVPKLSHLYFFQRFFSQAYI